MEAKLFANQIIKWYDYHKRDLPWRHTKDPYKIWLSEIILQQTRVAQGLPYYEKFVMTYPTVFDLAKASETEVLRLWQGLGYYSRARNLHACAKMVVTAYNGSFPDSYDELLKLKGIGTYTAAAIASFAFDKANAVVDGNVYRVLSRVFGIKDDIASSQGPRVFRKKANELISQDRPADYNQGIMEFGAMQCSPATPACGLCPVSLECYAFNHNEQLKLPVKTKKVKVRERHFNYIVFRVGESYYVKERGPKDVWQGLYDFYLIETPKEEPGDVLLERLSEAVKRAAVIEDDSQVYKHILTHQRIFAKFYLVELENESSIAEMDGLRACTVDELKELPKPILIQKYLEREIF
ncbi:MAG: A/G-specific adenine glycosylase [Roseivirga sp.]|nr:A/G-specific adenine glycosylase [Roseivirga sp.]